VARLPLKYAVKTVYGRGSRVIYTFEDPNCGYCQQLHATLGAIGDLTVYTFVVSFLGDDSVRQADAVWCAKDRAATWHRVMQKKTVAAARKGCTAPNTEVKKLIGLLGINLTPTVFYASGERMNGVKPRAEVEQRLDAAKIVNTAENAVR
jgi:thiol:disulfide interchange protein DsbC